MASYQNLPVPSHIIQLLNDSPVAQRKRNKSSVFLLPERFRRDEFTPANISLIDAQNLVVRCEDIELQIFSARIRCMSWDLRCCRGAGIHQKYQVPAPLGLNIIESILFAKYDKNPFVAFPS